MKKRELRARDQIRETPVEYTYEYRVYYTLQDEDAPRRPEQYTPTPRKEGGAQTTPRQTNGEKRREKVKKGSKPIIKGKLP